MIWENFAVKSPMIEHLGWTLVHSVWQLALIALILFLVLRVFVSLSAKARYLLAVSALALALALSAATFISLSGSSTAINSGKFYDAENGHSAKNSVEPPQNFAVASADRKAPKTAPPAAPTFLDFENLKTNLWKTIAAVLPALVWLWFLGTGVYMLRLFGGVWHLHRYKTQEIMEPAAEWRERFSVLCERLKIRQPVTLLESGLVKTPVVVGWLKPLILVPAAIFLQMSPRELETILTHELVHIRRYDNLVNFAQSFVEILFFYHPCAWWISGVIRREREYACDDAVLEIVSDGRRERLVYADALASLEEIRRRANEKTPPRLTTAASGGQLMKRIERIIEKNTEMKRSSSKQSFLSASLALLLISAFLICVFSAQSGLSVNAEKSFSAEKKMAIGFVSIPPLDRSVNPPQDSDATARLLIEKLKAHRVPAIGFVQGGMVSDGTSDKLYPVRANIVRLWRDAGFEIGIGGFRHIWFYNTPYEEYVANVEKNERLTKKILAEKNMPLQWFSYPYLNTGKTAADAERFENWLKERGLRSVKYSFDNQEWMYSFAYDAARKDNDIEAMNQIAREFLEYMAKMLAHYEGYSQEMFRRDIPQTLVLTPSRLVADTSDAFFGMFERQGYRFVSMDEALKDEAYETKAAHVDSQSGISWFERWQMAQNKKLRDEPRVSPLVNKIWNEKKPGK